MAQIKKKFIGADQVDGTKARLDNNQALRARNQADSADVDLIKLNASDVAELSTDLDMAANDIVDVGLVDGRDVSADGSALDAHLNGGANKHDANEIDYERADGSKKNIQAASDDVESALSDLDDAIGALDQTPTNYTPADPAIVADHLAAIDAELANAGSDEFSDASFRIQDDGDATKEIAFQASGITTATTRTITMPDANVNLGDIAANRADIDDLRTLSGTADGAVDLGSFTGATIPDASDIKEALQALETAHEEVDQNVNDLITLSGVAENATSLGTFTGATIPDSSTVKAALQSLETAHEEVDQNVNDLITLSGVAENATDLGAFTGATIPDNSDVKEALQALETEVETKADDADVIKKDGSVAFTAAQSMGGFKLTNVADPTTAQDAATKSYVDAVAEGLKPKTAARAATVANLDLSTDLEDGDSLDGVTLATGDRVLVKDQSAPEENGIYVVQASGAAVRATDFDSLTPIDEINGAYVPVQEGTENEGKFFVQSGAVAVLDTDPINFVYFNSVATLSAGDGIDITANVISVDLAASSGLEFSSGELRANIDSTNNTTALNGSNEIVALRAAQQIVTLNGTDITNQYYDLAVAAHSAASISLCPVDGIPQEQGVDYTVSLTGGSGGVTRISFAGDLATGGDAALVATDKLIIKYERI